MNVATQIKQTFFTTQETASMIGVSDSRVRQLHIEHGIGSKFGRDLMFTAEDVERLKKIPDRRRKDT